MLKRLTRIRKVSLQRADPQEIEVIAVVEVLPCIFRGFANGDTRQFRQLSPGDVADGAVQPYRVPVRDKQTECGRTGIHGQRGQGTAG